MQICVSRMLQESGIFFAVSPLKLCNRIVNLTTVIMQLLSVLGIGFAQGLYALDAADGSTEEASVVFAYHIPALGRRAHLFSF